ncbi:hypothetical protein Acr_07g0013750 [Actinidia rufa]|uniref:Uncharacterized protein n=1 Tax=Actinidia rufa TaxID=165716 RepID=A0A7J0EYY1_9ERIC|nr:hypothetical protein Acr_07g0013750 [Actinidia rufa]
MELNRAQLLVHDDVVLAQFCVDHNIPDNVLIERLGPNEDANLVEGEGNRIPVRTWLVFVNFIRTVLAMDVLMQQEGKEFLAEDLLHVYYVVRPRRDPDTHMYIEEGKEAAGAVGNEEEDVEVEEGEMVNQGEDQILEIAPPTQILSTELVLVLILDSEATDDLAFLEVAPAAEDLIEHSFNLGGSSGLSSREVDMAPKIKALFSQGPIISVRQQAKGEVAYGRAFSSLKGEGSWNTIMLPLDVADLAGEGSEEFKDKLIMQGVQARNEAEASLAHLNKALQENAKLKRVASKEIFQKAKLVGQSLELTWSSTYSSLNSAKYTYANLMGQSSELASSSANFSFKPLRSVFGKKSWVRVRSSRGVRLTLPLPFPSIPRGTKFGARVELG